MNLVNMRNVYVLTYKFEIRQGNLWVNIELYETPSYIPLALLSPIISLKDAHNDLAKFHRMNGLSIHRWLDEASIDALIFPNNVIISHLRMYYLMIESKVNVKGKTKMNESFQKEFGL